ncbi:MAG: DUF6464 family protein [Cyanobacteria bacterium P01_C01_bin.73]
MMITVLMIFVVGFSPAIVSLLISRRNQAQTLAQFAAAREAVSRRNVSAIALRLSEVTAIEGSRAVIGDVGCRWNARSPYLRCAVNPCGPCDDCPHFL